MVDKGRFDTAFSCFTDPPEVQCRRETSPFGNTQRIKMLLTSQTADSGRWRELRV